MKATELLAYAQRLQALAQAGFAYATSPYDIERYAEIRTLSARLLEALTDEISKNPAVFASKPAIKHPKWTFVPSFFADRTRCCWSRRRSTVAAGLYRAVGPMSAIRRRSSSQRSARGNRAVVRPVAYSRCGTNASMPILPTLGMSTRRLSAVKPSVVRWLGKRAKQRARAGSAETSCPLSNYPPTV